MTKKEENNARISEARKADLAEYFSKSGYTLKHHGSEVYIKEVPGLCINKEKNSWYSHYDSKGGFNSIDCLTNVLSKDFKTAVSELTGEDLKYSSTKSKYQGGNYANNNSQNFQKNQYQALPSEYNPVQNSQEWQSQMPEYPANKSNYQSGNYTNNNEQNVQKNQYQALPSEYNPVQNSQEWQSQTPEYPANKSNYQGGNYVNTNTQNVQKNQYQALPSEYNPVQNSQEWQSQTSEYPANKSNYQGGNYVNTNLQNMYGSQLKESSPERKFVQNSQEPKSLKMPEQADNMRRVFAYFYKTRKIPSEIVSELANAKLLYQSSDEIKATVKGIEQTFKTNNAVFVHKDENGKVIGGEIQGINTFKRYKGVAAGTVESAFQFTPVPRKDGKITKAYIFESAIDLMSFYSFCKDKNKLEGAAFISMAGLKPMIPKRLEAQGIEILSCVDNDEKGRKFTADNGFKDMSSLLVKENVKDWNDLLVKRSEGAMPEKTNVLKVDDSEKKNILSWGRK